MVSEILCSLLNNNSTCHNNEELEPIQPVQMNIYWINTYREDLRWLYVDSELTVQERRQVYD